jgi:hypothetical protein
VGRRELDKLRVSDIDSPSATESKLPDRLGTSAKYRSFELLLGQDPLDPDKTTSEAFVGSSSGKARSLYSGLGPVANRCV